MPPLGKLWTAEEDQYLRDNYTNSFKSLEQLAEQLNIRPGAAPVTVWMVRKRTQELGLNRSDEERGIKHWTPEEEERMQTLLEKYSVRDVARILGRSENSVKIRATRRHMSLREHYGWYTALEVAQILGVDSHLVVDWIDRGLLKARWHSGSSPQAGGSSKWHIEEEDLAAFIRRFARQLRGRKIDLDTVVDMLGGKLLTVTLDNPIYHGIVDNPKFQPTRHGWSNEDNAYLQANYDFTHESQREIAQYLSAKYGKEITEWQVRKQIADLGLMRSFQSIWYQTWSPFEDKRLRLLLRDRTVEEVASILHRSVSSVEDRAYKLGLSLRFHPDWYTPVEAAQVLGVDPQRVTNFIVSGQLRIKDGQIQAKDLANFVRRYTRELQGHRVDLGTLIDILSGAK